jgi:hypothetical protein
MQKLAGLSFLCLVGCHGASVATTTRNTDPNTLLEVSAFADIEDPQQRSQSLFAEASKVMLHPRCVNCHPPDDSPRQLDNHRLHDPPVTRGPDNHGVVGMECSTCHQDKNLAMARVPGAPNWHLAPKEMAWLGRSASQICEQIKDPVRNGGKSIAQIVEHSGHDELVAWGWDPGHDRAPAPGTQERFGQLMQAWADTGAVCPEGGQQ